MLLKLACCFSKARRRPLTPLDALFCNSCKIIINLKPQQLQCSVQLPVHSGLRERFAGPELRRCREDVVEDKFRRTVGRGSAACKRGQPEDKRPRGPFKSTAEQETDAGAAGLRSPPPRLAPLLGPDLHGAAPACTDGPVAGSRVVSVLVYLYPRYPSIPLLLSGLRSCRCSQQTLPSSFMDYKGRRSAFSAICHPGPSRSDFPSCSPVFTCPVHAGAESRFHACNKCSSCSVLHACPLGRGLHPCLLAFLGICAEFQDPLA